MTVALSFLIIVGFSFIPLMAHTQFQTCDNLKSDPIYLSLVDQIALAKQNNISAVGFRIYDYPILFTSESDDLCVSVFNSGKARFIELETPLEIRNGFYEGRDEHNLLSEADETQLGPLFESEGLKKLLIYKINTSIIDDFNDTPNTLRSHYSLLVHEGFHLLEQNSYFSMSHYSAQFPYINWTTLGLKTPSLYKTNSPEVLNS